MRFDERGLCNYVNDRWTAITGLTIDEAIGNGWQRAVHPEDRAAVLTVGKECATRMNFSREEYRVVRPDSTIRWVLAEGAALRSYSRELLGFIRAVTDISRHRELEAGLTARAKTRTARERAYV